MRARLDLRGDGHLLLTGLFTSVDGKPRPGYAMLLSNGGVDESFEPWRGMRNLCDMKFLHGSTLPAALLEDGTVAVGNSAIQGPRQPFPQTVYRLDRSGALILPTGTNLPMPEFSRPSGLILTLGPVGFWTRKPVDWTTDTRADTRPSYLTNFPACDFPFERWKVPPTAGDAAAVFQALFDEVPFDLCRYAVRLPGGGAVIAIRDELINGARSAGGRFMRFDKDWRPDLTFTNYYQADLGSCTTLKLQKDGKLLIAGLAGKLNGEEFSGLVRLEKDGTLDRTFHCETAERITSDPVTDRLRRRVIGVAVQDDGRIVITGFFTRVNGIERQYIARLKPDGSLDESFKSPFTTWEGLKAWRRVPVHRLDKAGAVASNAALTNSPANAAEPPASSAPSVLIAMLEMQGGAAVIRFTGQPHRTYVLQARDTLSAGAWSNASTNQAADDGAGIFRDEEAKKHATRFYRIASPY
jgi:hypothetical protein